ncbi:ammonia-forming cytochrome c nitrite reductase subunit c552 [Canicola haemoglobinophilus]|uniref:Cytochrome c-552 n=1 Tax=Canicola haemoglobinophilus TaxID=733 RepID=A0A1V4B2L4_9PAST|nr:ammonia-forming nitrite reductase cytochrome c552 subunit [Canicola haemoglobinophilus]OOS01503.1 ammonia-forming cytochrome c nitrite reductase subunit c552 [Canicola haemoglobinophilus]STO54567.1 cytochrome c nitrite reductase subunit c552 [Canicola haemoglobinophilus]STO59960.1 cytochrome c nitrite reductase subunit c552 [Canicola haemoglobinophilus]STO67658.1 cytochrome c nitrite reductase subunit c552 [Canicola haemoglobinophilus]
MNIVRKTLLSLVVAGFGLSVVQTAVAIDNSVAEKRAPTKEELAKPTNVVIEANNSLFADKYPKQYESWASTAKSTEIVPAIEVDPRLIVMWGGYAFSKEYNKPRGHFYTVTDVRNILRTGGPLDANSGPQPMACWTCKGPDVPRLINEWGEEAYFTGKWAKGGAEIVNSIGCADCHDTTSKDFAEGKPALRIARPHVLRALANINKEFAGLDKTDQRAAVCANCHVEYYFDKKNVNNVVFPWMKGVDVDSIEKYYDETEFYDWIHSISKAPMLKAQHPDYETWLQGTHGKNGVTCVDCHMPKVQGADGKVYTDHKIGNPFDAFEHTCANCHDQSKETLQKVVEGHKKDIKQVMLKLEDQIVKAHFEAKAAWDAGATESEMKEALKAIRHAQWRWDYSAAGHGGHMHSPDIILKVIATGLDRIADARTQLAIILTKHGVQQPIKYPDVSTAEKAWKVMGIDIEKERADKEKFLKEIIPQWNKEAIEKGLIPEAPPAK